MPSQIPRLVLVLATAFLAGCISDPVVPTDVDETREYPDSDAPDAPENEPTTTPSGEPAPANEEPAPITTEPRDPEPATGEPASQKMRSIDVAFEGRTPARVCQAIDSSSVCLMLRPGDNTVVPLENVAKPVLLQGFLTWNASTPSNGHLVVQLMVHNGNEYVYSHGPWGARQVGDSPLPVSINLAKYEGRKLALAIRNDDCILENGPALNCAFAGGGNAMIDSPQEFAFNGELSGWD